MTGKDSSDWSALARVAIQRGAWKDAADALHAALEAVPEDRENLVIATEVYRKAARWEEALAVADLAVKLAAEQPAAWNNRGLVLLDLERPVEAEAQFRQAILIQPGYAKGFHNLGQSLVSQGRYPEAISAFESALAILPDYGRAQSALGHAFHLAGDPSRAVNCLREADRRHPGNASTLVNLANALNSLGELPEAEHLLRRAVLIAPGSATAWHDLGAMLEGRVELQEAVECYRRSLEERPGWGAALASLVNARRRLCDWDGLSGEVDQLMDMARSALAEGRACPLWPAASLRLRTTPAEQLAIARSYASLIEKKVGAGPAIVHPDPSRAGGRLRIGFLSREFAHSVAGYLMQGIFSRFDRTRFEIYCFDYSPDDGSAVRRRILSDCDHVVTIGAMTNPEAASAIAEAGIHLLFDITSYLPKGRPEIAALRPAPVQVSYMYPATLGADWVDYYITDPIVSPPGDDIYFSEKLIRLPGCYLPANREQAIATDVQDRAHWGLPGDGFVFASFNAPDKIDPPTFDSWMRILSAVPGSVLWQRDGAPGVRENLSREAGFRGIDPARLVFAPPVAGIEDHLARHQHAGLLLDTQVHGAHATAMDTLWAGLPLVTLPGETFSSRVASSALTAAGFPELIATDDADYERIAIFLARHPEELAELRVRLVAARLTSSLFDTDLLVRRLECACLKMWERFEDGLEPEAFEVSR